MIQISKFIKGWWLLLANIAKTLLMGGDGDGGGGGGDGDSDGDDGDDGDGQL